MHANDESHYNGTTEMDNKIEVHEPSVIFLW